MVNGPVYVAIYEVERCYGGPEEGGWWYDRGTVLDCWKLNRSETRKVKRAPGYYTTPMDRLKPGIMRRFERYATKHYGMIKPDPKRPSWRGRYSVIGGPDIEIRVMNRVPDNFPAERPHYE